MDEINEEPHRLTKEHRRRVCVHESGHAIIASLGGTCVYRLAVAPEGCGEHWEYQGRKGPSRTGAWGVCEHADYPLIFCSMAWNNDYGWIVDRKHYEKTIDAVVMGGKSLRRKVFSDWRRIVRANVCRYVAGPAAEQIFDGVVVSLYDPDDDSYRFDDLVLAQAFSRLLWFRSEYDHACELTEATLRRPEMWDRVIGLADVLERKGDLSSDEIMPFLPDELPGWPPSPMSRQRRRK